MVEIWDCRRKERILTQRIGGDYEIAILDEKGVLKTRYWFEMKEPYGKSFKQIEKLMEEVKCQMKRQEK